MNACDHYEELISMLVDGELSRADHEALMAHLQTCSRCNAMYAVFHDLSGILEEDPAPVPEGLHENIMAGVRRQELLRKNRRMRKLGLRTALTAAACAVLVLFAAVGFDPGKRADSVSIRSEEAASQLLPTPAPAVTVPAPAAEVPVVTETQAPAWTPVPAATAAPAAEYDAYTAVEPEQPDPSAYYPFYYENQTVTEAPAEIAASQSLWTPEPVSAVTEAPVVTVAPADNRTFAVRDEAPPVVAEVPAVQTTADQELPAAGNEKIAAESVPEVETSETIETTPAAEAVPETETVEAPAAARRIQRAPSLFAAAPAETAEEAEPVETVEDSTPEDDAGIGDAAGIFSLFSSVKNIFESAPAESLGESKIAAVPNSLDMTLGELSDSGALSGIPLELPAQTPAPEIAEEAVSVYGTQMKNRLLALIGSREDSLPQEAELTRLVHVSLVPDDEYGSLERMDVSIYGDFVYCSLYSADGGVRTLRADCSLRELDDFFASCAAPLPSPAASTPDPYAADSESTETPAPVEAEVE